MLIALVGPFGWVELVAIGLVGVLLFGRRLPEVGKNIGRGIVEFKKGLSGLDDDAPEQGKHLEDHKDTDTQSASPDTEKNTQSTSSGS